MVERLHKAPQAEKSKGLDSKSFGDGMNELTRLQTFVGWCAGS